ncbi:MAG: phage portal protein [Gemmatimonadetes bacterium]|nr:phage portal protein [Gemmatimonadota bacterium]
MLERLKQRISGIFDTPIAPENRGGVTQRHQPRPFSKRSIDAARGTRRQDSLGTFMQANGEIGNAVNLVRDRVRYLSLNDSYIRHGLNNWIAECVGNGLMPAPLIEGTDRQTIIRSWERFTRKADWRGGNFSGLQTNIVRAVRRDGEALCIFHHNDDEGLKIELIDVARIDTQKTQNLANGIILNGVELDRQRRVTAIWIRPKVDDWLNLAGHDSIRFPAGSYLHVFEPEFAGQVRGISPLASAVLNANDLAELHHAQRRAALTASMLAAFVRNPNSGEPFEIDDDITFEPGAMLDVGNSEIQFSNPQNQGDAIDKFSKSHVRQLSAGLDVPTWLTDGDMSQVNYSSARSVLMPLRRKIEMFRENVLVPHFLNPVWERWAALEMVNGRMNEGVEANWIAPAFYQVDPEKQTKSIVLMLKHKLISRESAIRMIHGSQSQTIIQELEGEAELTGMDESDSYLRILQGGSNG